MRIGLDITATHQLRQRLAAIVDRNKYRPSPPVRKGMSNAGRLIARAQKERAPVRQGRVSIRKLKRNIAAGQSLVKARAGATTVVKKFRSIGRVKTSEGYVRPDGPLRYIPPGLLKRSIGFRVRSKEGVWQIVTGANVGKKRKSPNFAPHRAFVGSGTVQRFSNGRLKGNEYGPKRVNRGRMPANPYIMAGLHASSSGALRAVEAGIQVEMNQALKGRLVAARAT
jgi:hypothetical protein